jgi:hypothetical protein
MFWGTPTAFQKIAIIFLRCLTAIFSKAVIIVAELTAILPIAGEVAKEIV